MWCSLHQRAFLSGSKSPIGAVLDLCGLASIAPDATYMLFPNDASRSAGNRHYLLINGQWVDVCPLTAGSMAATGEITGGCQSISVAGTVESFSIIWNNAGLPVVAFSIGFNRALTAAERTALSSTTFWAAILSGTINTANCTALYPWLAPCFQSLVGFWDANAITGLANSDPCGTWNDKSGLGNHATQTGAASVKPTYLTGQLNGLPSISFDGGDYLLIPAITAPEGVFTVFIVGYCASSNIMFSSAYVFANSGKYIRAHATGIWAAADASHISAYSLNAADFATTHKIIRWACDGTHANHVISVNGTSKRGAEVALNTTDPGSAAVSRIYSIGATPTPGIYTTGKIAEILFFKSRLSAQDELIVSQYLSAKWGIALS